MDQIRMISGADCTESTTDTGVGAYASQPVQGCPIWGKVGLQGHQLWGEEQHCIVSLPVLSATSGADAQVC